MCLGAKKATSPPAAGKRNNPSKGQSSPTVGTQSQVGYLSTILVSISMKSCLAGGTEYPKAQHCIGVTAKLSVTQPDSDRLSERSRLWQCVKSAQKRFGDAFICGTTDPDARSATRTSVKRSA